MNKIGVIGLGNIGSYYVKRLREAGYTVIAYDLVPARVEAATAQGAAAATSPGDVTDRSDMVVLCLPNSPAVEQVMEGEDGILNHLRAGQLVIDTGTIRPSTDIAYAKRCAERGGALIDSPLTWRGKGHILMVGGSDEDVARAEPLLKALSYKYLQVGGIGKGQELKLLNQAVQAGQWAVYSECIELAKHQGVDPRLLKDYLEFNIPDVLLGDDYISGGQLALHYKDLGYLFEMAHDSGAHIPLMSLIHEIFKRAWLAGHPRWSQAGVITYWREMNEGRDEEVTE